MPFISNPASIIYIALNSIKILHCAELCQEKNDSLNLSTSFKPRVQYGSALNRNIILIHLEI